MKNVLVISGHPNLKQSTSNITILNELAKALPNAEIRKLDELYPNYQFDIEAEQASLANADVIVFQFPFNWYSAPGILKLYIDKVFVQGWAYGLNVTTLSDKKLIISFTTGAPEQFYNKNSILRHEPAEFNYYLELLASRCHMELAPIIYNCGMTYIEGISGTDVRNAIIAKAKVQAKLIVKTILQGV